MGVAVLDGSDLIFTTIKTIKVKGLSGAKTLVKLEKIIKDLIVHYAPNVLAVEEPLPIQKKRSPLLNQMFNRIKKIGRAENLEVISSAPNVVRQYICAQEKPTKLKTAFIIATNYYSWLYRYYEKDLAKKWWEEKYWASLFDAVALGLWVLAKRSMKEEEK